MNKNALLCLLVLLSMVLLFSNSCNRQGSKNDGQNNGSESSIEEKLRTPDPLDLYERLMHSFSADWMERESDPNLYPVYYGGSYVDDNHILVITVTGDKEANRKKLVNILGTEDFKVNTVQYSYRQMMQVMERIDDFLFNASHPEDHPLLYRFAGAYPDVELNRVKVLLTTVSQESINAFKRDVSDSPLVVFEQGNLPELF